MELKRPESDQPIPENADMVFRGELFEVYQWEEETFDGSKLIFEKVKRPDTVVVFPVLKDGRVVLAHQEQPGKKPFMSALGGRVNEKEDVLVAAERELLEESGYEAEKFILWGVEHPVSKVDWVVYTFVAKGVERVKEPELESGERIETKPVAFDEFIEVVLRDDFSEKMAWRKVMEAKASSEKMAELRELFDPSV
ncbi:MAG: NUDIX hydrolase [Patescibacteria group bacterium]